MKVYLLYSSYDDGQDYESQSRDYLDKIVDSEEKAKKWIFGQALGKCDKLANTVIELIARGKLCIDEDGPYYVPFEEDDLYLCAYKNELGFYLDQLKRLKSGDNKYVIYDSNGYEQYGFTYKVREVE